MIVAEEKKRERYEHRERNSDLRLQVYELEKRSQLLGQSIQVRPVACVEIKLHYLFYFFFGMLVYDFSSFCARNFRFVR